MFFEEFKDVPPHLRVTRECAEDWLEWKIEKNLREGRRPPHPYFVQRLFETTVEFEPPKHYHDGLSEAEKEAFSRRIAADIARRSNPTVIPPPEAP